MISVDRQETARETAATMCSLARHNRVEELSSILETFRREQEQGERDINRQGHGSHHDGGVKASSIPVGVDERDKFGNTILTTACQNGLKRVAKLALRHGADINLRNFTSGNTPLHFCFKYGYGDTLGAYLISKGADDSVRNLAGASCYEVGPGGNTRAIAAYKQQPIVGSADSRTQVTQAANPSGYFTDY